MCPFLLLSFSFLGPLFFSLFHSHFLYLTFKLDLSRRSLPQSLARLDLCRLSFQLSLYSYASPYLSSSRTRAAFLPFSLSLFFPSQSLLFPSPSSHALSRQLAHKHESASITQSRHIPATQIASSSAKAQHIQKQQQQAATITFASIDVAVTMHPTPFSLSLSSPFIALATRLIREAHLPASFMQLIWFFPSSSQVVTATGGELGVEDRTGCSSEGRLKYEGGGRTTVSAYSRRKYFH